MQKGIVIHIGFRLQKLKSPQVSTTNFFLKDYISLSLSPPPTLPSLFLPPSPLSPHPPIPPSFLHPFLHLHPSSLSPSTHSSLSSLSLSSSTHLSFHPPPIPPSLLCSPPIPHHQQRKSNAHIFTQNTAAQSRGSKPIVPLLLSSCKVYELTCLSMGRQQMSSRG